jgi:hypothetical protein
MLVLGLAGISITLVAAINLGTVPLGSFTLTPDNVYSQEAGILVPRSVGHINLKISGEQSSRLSLELERRSAGGGHIDRLEIGGLVQDRDISPGLYYFPVAGEFTVAGPFQAGDAIYINTVNASSFEGKLKLELTGSKKQGGSE